MKYILILFVLLSIFLACNSTASQETNQEANQTIILTGLSILKSHEGLTFKEIEQKNIGLTERIEEMAGEEWSTPILDALRKKSLPMQIIEGVYPTIYSNPYSVALVADIERGKLYLAYYDEEKQVIEEFLESESNIPIPYTQWVEDQN